MSALDSSSNIVKKFAKTSKKLRALTQYPLQQDSDKAYPHFDVTSGFIVGIDPHEQDVKEGVIIPCVKKGRWYFKGEDGEEYYGHGHDGYFGAVAWHESEDNASQPHTHTGDSCPVATHSVPQSNLKAWRGDYIKYTEMVDRYTKQKCLISQIVDKKDLPSHLCGYITQFAVYHPDDKNYFTYGRTYDGWLSHTYGIQFMEFSSRECLGLFDAKKFRDYSKLPNEKEIMELKCWVNTQESLWRTTVSNTCEVGGPVSLPNGMCVGFKCYDEVTNATVKVRYNKHEECVGIRFHSLYQNYVEEDFDEDYLSDEYWSNSRFW